MKIFTKPANKSSYVILAVRAIDCFKQICNGRKADFAIIYCKTTYAASGNFGTDRGSRQCLG